MRIAVALALGVALSGCWVQQWQRSQVGALTGCRGDDVRIVADLRHTIVARDCRGQRHVYRVGRDGYLRPRGE